MKLLIPSSLALLVQTSLAANADDWRSRSIYQVFTDRFARTDGDTTYPCDPKNNVYCGGTWKGIINRLDYIQNLGFTAIWISPVTAQITEAYHGYYQRDLYSVNPNFGSADDLKSLASALHARGMYLMVDVVPNHMGWPGCHDTVDYEHFAVFRNPDHYHTYCPINNMANQTEVEACWLGNCNVTMPDLKTEHPEVADEMKRWIKSLVSNYSIDGLRIDSVKNVNRDFFPPFCAAAGVFCMGEVSEGQANYTYPYQRYMDSVLDYPLYYAINRVFHQKSNMSDLVVNLASCKEDAEDGCRDATLLGTFFENHDNPRFASETKDLSLAENAITFLMLGDGIPIMYQGQEQHLEGGEDPGCREALWLSGYNTDTPLYKLTATLNRLRSQISRISSTYLTYWTRVTAYEASHIQLRKDAMRLLLTNEGEQGPKYTLKSKGMEFDPGETVIEALGCDSMAADENGEVEVQMEAGKAKALVPRAALGGSGICGT